MDPRNCPRHGCCLINVSFPVSLCQEKLSDARTSNTTTPQPPFPGTSLSTSRRPSVRMSGTPFVSTPEFLSLAVTFGGHGSLDTHQQPDLDRWMYLLGLRTVSEQDGSSLNCLCLGLRIASVGFGCIRFKEFASKIKNRPPPLQKKKQKNHNNPRNKNQLTDND